ncbi:hypothetical protein [uncultured Caulobacter sp.]|uniref:hypothetical protein n=1 Tax=uncultured Caulobacter sp. TaxID=158749 RepID=UPI002633EB60|nr:hypothetical protein [uncultured Caulobacter sp.]
MRITTMRAMALLMAAGLGGCAGGFKGSPDTTIDAAAVSACPVTAKGAAPTRANYDKETADPKRAAARNAFIDSCVAAIDTSYGVFAQGLSTDQKTFAVGSDIATSGLAAAATLAKSARTKTHLTTYASVVLGLRGSVDRELFLSKTLPVLVTQMDASRTVVMARIVEGKTRADADYSLDAALSDLKAYYAAGTLNGALAQVANDAGVKNDVAQKQIASVKMVRYATDASHKALFNYLLPDKLHIDPKHRDILLECAKGVIGPAPTLNDLYGAVMDGENKLSGDQRTALVGCAKSKDPNFDKVTQ